MATSTNGQPVSESDRADRTNCSEKIITWGLGLLTILYLGGIGYLFGCKVWCLTQNNRMGEAGDFIAGFTTPVVFLWLIYGYFLQRRELGLQRKELQQTRETLGEQVEVLQEQADAERRRSMPNLDLKGRADQDISLHLYNFGRPARDLELILSWRDGIGGRETYTDNLLDTDKTYDFSIPEASSGDIFYFTACFTSERHERFYQRWKIEITSGDVKIKEITEPTRLLDDQSPPAEAGQI